MLLLEDVVTNGRELLAAIDRLEKLGLRVTPYAVISRGLAPIPALHALLAPAQRTKTETNRPRANRTLRMSS